VIIRSEHFTFDSSNTSGFTINPERDYVFSDIEMDGEPLFYNAEGFGNCGFSSPPLKGHSTTFNGFFAVHPTIPDWPLFVLTFAFANPDWGWTDIVLNEVNINGAWRSSSNFIELYNQGDTGRSLNGWQIVCDTIYSLPADAFIPPHGFYVIDEDNFPASFDIDVEMDNIYLISPDSAYCNNHVYITGPRIVDQVGWSSDHGENMSFMRYPDGDADSTYNMRDFMGYSDYSSTTFENGFPTRGAANRHDCPGFVAIGVRVDSLDDNSAKIAWTDPIWDTQFDYSVLVKSTDAYPTSPDEGDIIYEGTDQEFIDQVIIPDVTNYYAVFARNRDGDYSTPTDESQANILFHAVGIKDVNLPEHINTLACYPNPFNARTTINFSIAQSGNVEIAIYDIAGRLTETLAQRYYQAGNYSVTWNANRYSSGMYFARLAMGESNIVEKLVLLK
jgi:hypothetical protein